ncbi:hypothetical protein [Lentibacillus sp. CBA3610]|uniref:hypothetical protein n=1 Tax=Lentibacillus sp. CBA3610 TaxID=2518176 RepID=UPI001595CD84|nr:hypothetical protein [Lentibacillus sp. CBA3610]QKY68628.1 hypothetical protein Len3610_02415 [Lentibacillus sp. CBA3610]
MGYILPINHYQYSDYQNRVREKTDPFHIEKPYKTILRTDYYNHHRNQAAVTPSEDAELKLSTPKPPTADKLYAELTGKGRHFSSTI